MKKIFFTFLVFLIAIQIQAQEEDNYKYALQFGIGSNLMLTNYEQYSLSDLILLQNDNALRVSTIFYGSGSPSESTEDDSTIIKTNRDYFKVGLSIDYILNIIAHKRTSFFVYGGPLLDYSYKMTKSDWINPSGPDRTNKETDIGLGANLGVGVEYYLSEGISLGGEYSLSLIYNKKVNEDFAVSKTVTTDESFSLSPFQAKLVLSIYF